MDIFGKFKDGGVLITYPIFILLLVCIALFVMALRKPENRSKLKAYIASIGWFVVAWGYLGRTLGLIQSFDNVAVAGQITPALLSGGLKMALLGPLFGLLTFAIARIFILILISKTPKAELEK